MSTLYNKYNQENYLTYISELGIYDTLNSPIISKIKELKWESSINSNNKDLDEIALLYLKNEQLWWVIAYYNNVIDPTDYEDLVPVLYIPNRLDVELLLTEFGGK